MNENKITTTSDVLLWADGFGSWHAEADTKVEAVTGIMLALRERGDSLAYETVEAMVEGCQHSPAGRTVWCENETHHHEAGK